MTIIENDRAAVLEQFGTTRPRLGRSLDQSADADFSGATVEDTPKSMQKVLGRGVMASVRIGCERFSWSIRLADLGLIPTREDKRTEVLSALNAVLPNRQRASLLPRDEMRYAPNTDTPWRTIPIPFPEQTERAVRALFPTRYSDGDGPDRRPDTPNGATWYVIPLNGMTFIPLSAWNKWKEEFDKARDAHMRGAQLIIEHYDRLKKASIRHYTSIGMDVYNRIRLTDPSRLSDSWAYVTEDNASRFPNNKIGDWVPVPMDPLTWIRRWRRTVIKAWPTKEEIIANYRVDVRFFWAPIDNSDSSSRQMQEIFEADFVNGEQEYFAYQSMRDEVFRAQASQVNDLTTGYIKTILERVELVFVSFLKNAESGSRGVTPRSFATIAQVVDMVKVLGKGVYGIDGLKAQMQQIETFIEENQSFIEGKAGNKAKAQAIADANESLPEVLARAVEVLRAEAEAIIGNEARRTAFADDDPTEILNMIRADSSDAPSGSRSSGFEESAPQMPEMPPMMGHFRPEVGYTSDEMASSRRI